MSLYGKKHRIIGAINREDIPLLIKLISDSNLNPYEEVDRLGNNMLLVAAELGKLKVIEFLTQELGMSIHSMNDFTGQNCMHRAVKAGQIETVKYLSSKGVNRNLRDLEWRMTASEFPMYFVKQPECFRIRSKLLEIKHFFKLRDIIEESWESVKCPLWAWSKVHKIRQPYSRLPFCLYREVAEYF